MSLWITGHRAAPLLGLDSKGNAGFLGSDRGPGGTENNVNEGEGQRRVQGTLMSVGEGKCRKISTGGAGE